MEYRVGAMGCDLHISNPGILDTLDLENEMSYPTPYVNSPLLPLLILTLIRQRIGPKTTKSIQSEYDYIVVGAGAGGSVVASRLSEVSDVNVLVLEAGKRAPVIADIPALSRYFIHTDLDWAYKTVPQKNAGRSLRNRQVNFPSGKGLGGSSIIGAGMYQRGNRRVYDDWAAQGATGWSFDEVFPYFLKLEDNWDYEFLANGYHSIGGPSTAQRPGYDSEIACPILDAATQMGLEIVDTNGPQQTGISDFQGDMGGGQKCNSAEDYLVQAENRTNLDIVTNARVTKVIVRNKRAVGVQFDYGGSSYSIKARREVIVSAGTVNTAQLLMLSGIGPKQQLQQMNIPVIADLPVGQNFQDHSVAVFPYLLDPSILTTGQKLKDLRYIEEYISNRTGPLASLEFTSLVAFLPRDYDPPSLDYPGVEIFILEVSGLLWGQINLLGSAYNQIFSPYENRSMFACISSAVRPKSQGVVQLQSADPYDPPLIDPNYFADPSDVADVVQGLKTCHAIATSEPMQQIGSTPFATLIPGCEQYSSDLDAYFECVATSMNIAFNHAVGTCKMGDPADPTTVVDPQLRVKGIEGLRIVDASVMPIIPNANTYIPTVMVGEKAADMIKDSTDFPVTSWDSTFPVY